MSRDGEILKVLEESLSGRDWAVAREVKSWIPLKKDPVAEARIAYEIALAKGAAEQTLVDLGLKYTDLRDAQPVIAPEQQTARHIAKVRPSTRVASGKKTKRTA